MDIGEFLITKQVPYAYAHYVLIDGQKETVREKNNCALVDLPEWKEKSKSSGNYIARLKRNLRVEESKNVQRCFSLFLKYWDVVCIDCDDKNIHTPSQLGEKLGIASFTNDMCWTPGNTKGIHMYIKKPANWNPQWEGTKVLDEKYPDIDVIFKTKNMWERQGKLIYNDIQEFDMTPLIAKYKLKKRKEPQTSDTPVDPEIEEIKVNRNKFPDFQERATCECLVRMALDQELFKSLPDDYDTWIKVCYIIVNNGLRDVTKFWLRICEQMPDKSKSTTEDRINQLKSVIDNVQQNEVKSELGVGTLFDLFLEYLDRDTFTELRKDVKAKEGHYAYNYIKEIYEKDHFIMNGKFMRINEDGTLHTYTQSEAKVQYGHYYYRIGKAVVEFIDDLKKDKNKRIVSKLVMRPDLPIDLDQSIYPQTYNMFRGYEIQKHGDIKVQLTDEETSEFYNKSSITDHLYNRLCNGDSDVYAYVIQWLAHLLFAPHEMDRFHTCLVFYSETEGIGKSFITHDLLIEKIIGKQYGVSSSKMAEFFGEFNDLLENKLYVLLEEGQRKDAVQFTDVMKDALVANDIVIHKKGQNKYTTNNYVHICCNTNNVSVFNMSVSNRRYVVVQCKEEKMPEDDQQLLKKTLKDNKQVLTFCRYLFTKYDDTWNSESYVVGKQKEKEIWKQQIHLQISQMDQFLHMTYEDYVLGGTSDRLAGIYLKAHTPTEVYDLFKEAMIRAGRKDIWTIQYFGQELKRTGIKKDQSRKYKFCDKQVKEHLKKKHLLDDE